MCSLCVCITGVLDTVEGENSSAQQEIEPRPDFRSALATPLAFIVWSPEAGVRTARVHWFSSRATAAALQNSFLCISFVTATGLLCEAKLLPVTLYEVVTGLCRTILLKSLNPLLFSSTLTSTNSIDFLSSPPCDFLLNLTSLAKHGSVVNQPPIR